VIVRTGWERFWEKPTEYRNNHIFPSISGQSAEFLLRRGIQGLGVDTLSPDRRDSCYPVHKLLLGEGLYIIENIANSYLLPPKGAYSFAAALKTQDGAEAPIRFVGFKKM
jgi:kynurenine formamidase